MLRYLKAAFWLRQPVPLLGQVPFNVLALLTCAILGIGHPSFWLVGLTFETAYLATLIFSPRFRRLVDAFEAHQQSHQHAVQHDRITHDLTPENRLQHQTLEKTLAEISDLYARFSPGDPQAEVNLHTLGSLRELHARLLLARQQLIPHQIPLQEIEQKKHLLQRELQSATLTPAARRSKEATLQLLQQRLQSAQKRQAALDEIQSDLHRIETQIQLARESAAMHAKPGDLSIQLDYTSKAFLTPDSLSSLGLET